MSEELKPCPFCGGEASPNGVIRRSSSPDCRWSDGTECLEAFYCNCMKCGVKNGGALSGGYQTRENALTAWNARAESPLAASHARLVEALGLLLADADYGNGACRINEPIAAVLPPETLVIARAALADAKKVIDGYK